MNKLYQKKHFYLLSSLIVTIAFLSPNLFNDFLNWDDTAYVINNDLIKDFSFRGIKNIFTTPEVVSTYAPLTLMSWALDYAIDGLNPAVFHFFNLLLHLFVVSLVFYFTKLLSRNVIIAFITAVLFGIHPMHVEVIGWISARKDLLYTLFFIGALIAYYFYTEKETKFPKYYYYIACLLFFLLSLLSKGTAVILPIVLFLMDYLKIRKLNIKLIVEKLPFLLLSVVFVILSIKMQSAGGAMEDRQFTTILDSLSVGFYGYITYLIKVIVPFNLSAYHPYPNQLGESNPWFYYASAIPILVLFTWLMTRLKKNRTLIFGFGFFFITLIPVIQVLPFGTAVTADRYTYLSYFGLFYIASVGLVELNKYSNKLKIIVPACISIYVIILGITSFQYSKTFKDGGTLWSNVIKHYPNNFLGYMNRADYRISKKQYEKAIEDSEKAIKYNPDYSRLYYNRSFAYSALNKKDEALKDLNSAITKDESYMVAYLNRGLLYGENNLIEEAINDFSKVIQFAPKKYYGYFNRATYYYKIGEYTKALSDLNTIINLDQFLDETYYLRGKIYLQMRDVNNAFKDFSKTLEINMSFARAHTQRGHLWLDKSNFEQAILDYDKAVLLDKNEVDAFINLGIIYMNTKKYNKAAYNFEKAKAIRPNNFLVYYNKGLLNQLTKKYKQAIIEFDKALKLNPKYIPAKQSRAENIKLLNSQQVF
jgi:tetratricopeptide (TPR) repeat protein